MNIEEKRKYSRIHCEAPVTVRHANRQYPSKLIDISLKGVLIARPLDWDNAIQSCLISVNLQVNDIHMVVETAHVEKDRIGFLCTSIDLDSIANLRRMVELNVGDELVLARELETMIKSDHHAMPSL